MKKIKLENYRHKVEDELAAIIFSTFGVLIFAVGICWAFVFIMRWWLL